MNRGPRRRENKPIKPNFLEAKPRISSNSKLNTQNSKLIIPISPLFPAHPAFFVSFPTTFFTILSTFSPVFSVVLQHLVKLLNVCARFYSPTLIFNLKIRVSTQSTIENRKSPIASPRFFAQKRRSLTTEPRPFPPTQLPLLIRRHSRIQNNLHSYVMLLSRQQAV